MYDLDGEDDDSIDITPEFMKHEEPETDAPEATAAEPDAPDTGDDKE
jgi:hypothetical protein